MSIGASGGLTTHRRLSTADTNSAVVKATAGKVYGWHITNVNAAVRFVKLYDLGSAPTVGTTTPKLTILVPGSTTGGVTAFQVPSGIAFPSGIGIGITTGVADADTGAAAANEQVVHLFYA